MRCSPGTRRASAAAAARIARTDNPLRAHGRLGAACGIEYAAQAMAVHGALAASAPLASTVASSVRGSLGAALGYLASVRDVALHVARLDDLESDLIAVAQRITGDSRTVLYEFSVSSARQVAAERARQHCVRAASGPRHA